MTFPDLGDFHESKRARQASERSRREMGREWEMDGDAAALERADSPRPLSKRQTARSNVARHELNRGRARASQIATCEREGAASCVLHFASGISPHARRKFPLVGVREFITCGGSGIRFA
jgi:hypothetical protein